MDQKHLASIIESILFVSNQPLSAKEISKHSGGEPAEVSAALEQLVEKHREGGIVLLENNGEYQFSTTSKNSTAVKNFLNAELREKLTDATVEVLAIIAYRQPISKSEIEAIRGVNSQYSIRHLLMRGLIEKTPNPGDARGFLYQTSTEFLQHLGLVSVKDLPDFEKLVKNIKLPESPQAIPETTESVSSAPNIQTETEKQEPGQTIITQTIDEVIIADQLAPTAETGPNSETIEKPEEFSDEDGDGEDEE